MAWRLANSLVTLRNQVNASYPGRSIASDGTIGNAAHAAVPSDHNPNAQGVVCALDITHSPSTGFNAHALADRLIENRHPNLKYIISDSRIASANTGWQWNRYNGSNPHDKHIHVSVGSGSDGRSAVGTYDDTSAWSVSEQEAKSKGDEVITVHNDGFWRDYVRKLFLLGQGKTITEQDFQAWVGKDAVNMVDQVLNNPAADQQIDYATWGKTAKEDRWDQQIYALRDEVLKLKAGKPVSQERIDKLTKQADELEQAIKAINQ